MTVNFCPICNSESKKVLENNYFPLHLPPRENKVENQDKKLQKLSIYQCLKCDFIFNEFKNENFYFMLVKNKAALIT